MATAALPEHAGRNPVLEPTRWVAAPRGLGAHRQGRQNEKEDQVDDRHEEEHHERQRQARRPQPAQGQRDPDDDERHREQQERAVEALRVGSQLEQALTVLGRDQVVEEAPAPPEEARGHEPVEVMLDREEDDTGDGVRYLQRAELPPHAGRRTGA